MCDSKSSFPIGFFIINFLPYDPEKEEMENLSFQFCESIHVYEPKNMEDFLFCWKDMSKELPQNKKNIIHWIGHGNTHGLKVSTDEHESPEDFLIWDEMRDLLLQIPEETRKTIILSMSSCYGHCAYNINKDTNQALFAHLLGYTGELICTEAIAAFSDLYEHVFLDSNWNVNDALAFMNKALQNIGQRHDESSYFTYYNGGVLQAMENVKGCPPAEALLNSITPEIHKSLNFKND